METPLFEIRKALTTDAAAIASVHAQSWRETYRGLVPDGFIESFAKSRLEMWTIMLSAPLARTSILVATTRLTREVVAFASGGPSRDEPPKADAELFAIYCIKSWQRKGLGRELLEQIAKELALVGFSSLSLWVLKGNPTEGFYLHMGGQPDVDKQEDFGGTPLTETRYTWKDIPLRSARL